MNARKALAWLMNGAAVVVTAAGVVAGATPASAAPGQSGATLHIIQDPQNQGNYLLAILGRFPMPQADAVGFLNNLNNGDCQGGMNYYVFGDDDGDEGARYIHFKPVLGAHNNPDGYLKASSQGLEYRTQIQLRKSFLNEDSGVFDDNDEIYAQAHFKDSDCKIRIQTSQVITRLF
ncbi:hypothetical protein ABQE44_07910 [Mycolicibacterium sp. XJ2546]